MLSRDTMLDRMMARDPAYDGRFITGVLSTGIYCLPSCRARNPKPENVRFFFSEDDARGAGLRPCKRCRPDDFYRHRDPDRECLEELVERLRERPADFAAVADLESAAGMGSSKLHALFRRHFHSTPARLLGRARTEAARARLLATDDSVSAVAYDVGFESLSSFNENFLRASCLTPGDYRRLRGARELVLRLPEDYPTRRMLAYIGRDGDSATQRASDGAFAFGCWLKADEGVLPVAVEGRVETAGGPEKAAAGRIVATVRSNEPLPETAATQAHGVLLRLFGLGWDPAPLERLAEGEPRLAALLALLARRRGLRIPQTVGPYEGLIWTIVGQQINLRFAYTLHGRLTELAGRPLGDELWAPPRPDALAEIPAEVLAGKQFSRRKIEYLLGLSARVADGELPLETLGRGTATAAEETLLAERGLGPWSVNYLMMRGFGFEDCVPVGDTGLTRGLQLFFGLDHRPGRDETLELMRIFAPYRSLATFHLWQSLEDAA